MPFSGNGYLWNYDSNDVYVYHSLFSLLVIAVISIIWVVKKTLQVSPSFGYDRMLPHPPLSLSFWYHAMTSNILTQFPTNGCDKDN